MSKKTTTIGDIYIANRCKGWSQAKSMERVIMFTKKTPTVMEGAIRKMLNAEKKFKKNKCKIG